MNGPDSFRAVKPGDFDGVDALLRAAFGRPQEAGLVLALRAAGLIETEVVMPWGKGVVAHLVLSRLVTPAGWLALAPVSVAPEWQGKRLGSRLLQGVLKLARIKGHSLVVVGKPSFYSRAGFVFDAALCPPYPADMTGVFGATGPVTVGYPAAFDGI